MNNILILVVLYTSSQVDYCDGHATLFKPPSRAFKWKVGITGADDILQVDVDHNGVNCGGRVGIKKHEGKCGICGDSLDEDPPRMHEAPGKFAGGKVTAQYQPGKIIEVGVNVTANHLGFLQFAICANNRTDRDPDQSCFEKLEIIESPIKDIFKDESYPPYIRDIKIQLPIGGTKENITAKVKLPDDIKWCSHCILQMTYTTGNDWGKGGENCKSELSALGCGFQETFRGCADVSIMSENPLPVDEHLELIENMAFNSARCEVTLVLVEKTTAVSPQQDSETTTLQSDRSSTKLKNDANCVAIGRWAGNTAMDGWCETSCNWTPSFCPANMCKC